MHCNGSERKYKRSTFYTCSTCMETQNLHFALLTDIQLTASDKKSFYLPPCRLNYLCICCVEIGSYLILNMLEGSSSMVLASSVQWCGASWSQWLAASLTIVNAPPPPNLPSYPPPLLPGQLTAWSTVPAMQASLPLQISCCHFIIHVKHERSVRVIIKTLAVIFIGLYFYLWKC